MESPFSPPVLYVTDDDDDDDDHDHDDKYNEHNIRYDNSLPTITDDNLIRKKRKLTNTNVYVNQTLINSSRQQPNDNYYQTIPNEHFYNQTIHGNEYRFDEHDSQSFLTYNWANDAQALSRINSIPIQSLPRMSILPPSNMIYMNKHQLEQIDTSSFIPVTHKNDQYIQQQPPLGRSISIPACTNPSPPLPLPVPTSLLVRSRIQSMQAEKNTRMSYIHSTPLSSSPHSAVSSISSAFHSPSIIPKSTLEIRREALNGTGILSAFYDSKYYRCNICKFSCQTSPTLLQHLFTHIFFCHQCSFYTFSNHSLHKHLFENHSNNIDPKNFDLLYVTRCADGTFGLCMDSLTKKYDEPFSSSTKTTTKNSRKSTKKKIFEQNLDEINRTNKQNDGRQLSNRNHLINKGHQLNTYILMKHRRCYLNQHKLCLHSLTLEYNICREHTIRHMCNTQRTLKRRITKSTKIFRLIDEIALCLKSVVNNVVNMKINRNSSDLVCKLPNNILNLIYPSANLDLIINLLKLNNKYDQIVEENKEQQSENKIRTSNQHIFILSSSEINKNVQTKFPSLITSMANIDSIYTQTGLDKLPISYDNTNRFLKGTTYIRPQSSNSASNMETVHSNPNKSQRPMNHSQISSTIDRNNNSLSSSKSRSDSVSNVIVLD